VREGGPKRKGQPLSCQKQRGDKLGELRHRVATVWFGPV